MYVVDDEFLATLADDRDGDGPLFRQVETRPGKPFLDIVAFGDVGLTKSEDVGTLVQDYGGHLDAFPAESAPNLVVSSGDLVGATLASHERRVLLGTAADALLSMADDDQAAVMAVPGNFDIFGDPVGFQDACAARLVQRGGEAQSPAKPGEHPVATLFRVMPEDAEEPQRGLPGIPLAYVAVVGLDSNHADSGWHDYGQICADQLIRFRRLVSTLRTTASKGAPLYVIAVTHHNPLPVADRQVGPLPKGPAAHADIAGAVRSTSANASGLIDLCRRLRVSLLLHANMHEREIVEVASMPLDPLRAASDLTVMSTPTLQRGRRHSGLARIRLNLTQGSMELAVAYARGLDGQPGAPVQTSRKLTSASRVSVGERRLYDAASRVIRQHQIAGGEGAVAAEEYRQHVVHVWNKNGCVPLGLADGKLPDSMAHERENRYNLLLLLRERNGRYELLLSRHTPLKPTEVGAWDALLMPAFTDVRQLLDHLHDDVVRQLSKGATDLAKADSAREFVAAVREVLQTPDIDGPLWTDELREICQLQSRKLSPTTGQVTLSEYHVVTLLPFVREIRSRLDDGDSAAGRRQQISQTLINWLRQLPRVSRPGEPIDVPGVIPVDSLREGGSGLRWEPSADSDDGGKRLGQPLPPGAIWFPLPDLDERRAGWRDCPMIAHRNLDVLEGVKAEIDRRRDAHGRYVKHLQLGSFAEGTADFKLVTDDDGDGLLPFDTPGEPLVEGESPPRSTVEALRRVQYGRDSDLNGRPYEQNVIWRVVLHRRELNRGGRRGTASVIMVFDASDLPEDGTVADVVDIPDHDRLGLLRPVQRYVMRAGLDRAKLVNKQRQEWVTARGHDPWGFARARFGGFAETLSLTPPIIEQLSAADFQFDGDDGRGSWEFLLCDGNHRVVQTVWTDATPMAAVAVLGEPRQPYYAYPFSAYEWENTASQIVTMSPPAEYRYAARRSLDPAEAAAAGARWYRRYFRDLNTGFGNVGAQGGRF